MSLSNGAVTTLMKNEKLNNFLEDGNSLILSANLETLNDGGLKIHLDNATHVGHVDKKVCSSLE